MRPSIVFDENLSETFLAEERNILWRERDTAFVRVYFSWNSHSQGRVGNTLRKSLQRVNSGKALGQVDVKMTY